MNKKNILLVDDLPKYFQFESGERRPKNIFDCFIDAANEVNMKVIGGASNFPKQDFKVYITCAPVLKIILYRILGKKIIFLNWQRLSSNKNILTILKNIKLIFAIIFSNIILTNIPKQRKFLGKTAIYFPYPVDQDFYLSNLSSEKKYDFILPGDNSRDYELLRVFALDNPGLSFAMISRGFLPADFLSDVTNITSFVNLSSYEYRRVLSESRAGLILTKENNHLAGQTVVLELLSMGIPVFVNNHYLYEIFRSYPDVIFIDSKKVQLLNLCFDGKFQSQDSINNHNFFAATSFLAKLYLEVSE